MYDFVNRAASMSALQDNIAALLGGAFDMEEVPANPAHREQFLLGRYRDTLVTRASQGKFRQQQSLSKITRQSPPIGFQFRRQKNFLLCKRKDYSCLFDIDLID